MKKRLVRGTTLAVASAAALVGGAGLASAHGGDAGGPHGVTAGSPGVACRRAKTAMATTPMTGMVASKRRAISGNTRYAPFIRRAAAS